MSIDDKWLNFVAENILFYTNILRLLLPRFFRMDLTTSKNAYMLFRISKIYSQAGLANLVKNGESGLDRIMSVVDFSLDRTGFSEMPPYNINSEVINVFYVGFLHTPLSFIWVASVVKNVELTPSGNTIHTPFYENNTPSALMLENNTPSALMLEYNTPSALMLKNNTPRPSC